MNYGKNPDNNEAVFLDRNSLRYPHCLVIGDAGSGKSCFAKSEIADVFMSTGDDIMILDAHGEYAQLVEHLNGKVIKISPESGQFVNPFDIVPACPSNYDDRVNLKIELVFALYEQLSGKRPEPAERNILHNCVSEIYRTYLAASSMPTLSDLYSELLKQPEAKHHIAKVFEPCLIGSLSVLNKRTNADFSNRIISFNISELGENYRKIGILTVYTAMWNKICENLRTAKRTYCYIEEFPPLISDELTETYFYDVLKRFRTHGGIMTCLTQNIDILSDVNVRILSFADFLCVLKCGGIKEIIDKLRIPARYSERIREFKSGEGLICFGDEFIPFVNKVPENTYIYKVMNPLHEVFKNGGA